MSTITKKPTASRDVKVKAEMSHGERMMKMYGTDRTAPWQVRLNNAL